MALRKPINPDPIGLIKYQENNITMKRLLLLLLLIPFFGMNSMAQKSIGLGGELTLFSARIAGTFWASRNSGFEIFAGPAAEMKDFKPNDLEAGFKYMHTVIYNWDNRLYLGVTGKWKWVNAYDEYKRVNLPVPGFVIGKEWYSKRVNRKSFAIELGYQMGKKDYPILSPINHIEIGKETFEEFPLILTVRYCFIQRITKRLIKRH